MFNINNIKIVLDQESVDRLVDISDEEYFGGDAFVDYVSNSSMSLINPAQGGSPTKFITGFEKKKSAGALELGTAVHRMILEKDKFFVDDLDKPSPKVCNVMDHYYNNLNQGMESGEAILKACEDGDYYAKNVTQTRIDNVLKEGKAYLEQLYDLDKCEGCITLTKEHKDKLDKCLKSVKANKTIVNLLEGELSDDFVRYNEDVFIMKAVAYVPSKNTDDFDDKKVDIWMKFKIDNWSVDFRNKVVTLNDLKTTGASIADFGGTEEERMAVTGDVYKSRSQGSFEKFHYYRQMAFYMMAVKAYAAWKFDATEEEGWTFKCNMLVVETTEPHYSNVFEVGERWLKLGEYEYESLLKRIAYHREYGYDSFTNITLNGTTIIW